jgi:hypothetical protein
MLREVFTGVLFPIKTVGTIKEKTKIAPNQSKNYKHHA